MPTIPFFDRDLSWLSFNYRVLQEGAKENVPLLERISFLSIYCSNLDEFYRVRIPALSALQKISKKAETLPGDGSLLRQIGAVVNGQLEHFGQILTGQILPALAGQGIHFIYDQPIPAAVKRVAGEYFFTQLLAFLQPVHLSRAKDNFFPENDKIYFAVVTEASAGEEIFILNIPSDGLPRFYRAEADNTQAILFIDDIIRDNLEFIFPGLAIRGAYSIKITRDAELDLEDEYDGDLAEKIEKKLAKRDAGLATRFLYQPGIPPKTLESLISSLGLSKASIVAGGRYHNLRDLAAFPVKDDRLSYPKWPSQKRSYEVMPSLFQRLSERDILLHAPYESYDPVLQFFNEASIDSSVEEIYLTMYRIARDSRIAHALISASRNGKKVTVFVELKARFDEANNLRWAGQMKAAGVKIIYSIPGLKVHAKVALVKKRSRQRILYYGLLATGNLNENTARFYTDHILLTGNHDLMRELELLFIFLGKHKDPRESANIPFQHLLVAQFNLHQRLLALIDREIGNAGKGLPSAITIKLNNLEEPVLITKLYEASQAGVKISLIVRSICCIIPGIPGKSENISVRRIVDRYLEHGRVFIFHNNGNEEIFLGSADWMNRNIYRRIEVCFPLYDEDLKREIREIIHLQLQDNIAAVLLDEAMDNVPVPVVDPPVRSQEAIYQYIAQKRSDPSTSTIEGPPN
ncbi:MAG TPA: polyphosphate kinase 1 [Puia sp.]|nr:polyphosphate kinase 1 [Puia sp.]